MMVWFVLWLLALAAWGVQFYAWTIAMKTVRLWHDSSDDWKQMYYDMKKIARR